MERFAGGEKKVRIVQSAEASDGHIVEIGFAFSLRAEQNAAAGAVLRLVPKELNVIQKDH